MTGRRSSSEVGRSRATTGERGGSALPAGETALGLRAEDRGPEAGEGAADVDRVDEPDAGWLIATSGEWLELVAMAHPRAGQPALVREDLLRLDLGQREAEAEAGAETDTGAGADLKRLIEGGRGERVVPSRPRRGVGVGTGPDCRSGKPGSVIGARRAPHRAGTLVKAVRHQRRSGGWRG